MHTANVRRFGAAVEIMKLNVLAYPESANANDSLSVACLADGERQQAPNDFPGEAHSQSLRRPSRSRLGHNQSAHELSAAPGPSGAESAGHL